VLHGTIWERPRGGIEVGQQPWELQRQGRHARGELAAKAVQAETKSAAAKLIISGHGVAQMR